MAKFASILVTDAALNIIKTATGMSVCSAQPTTRAEAITTYMLSTTAPTFTGPAAGSPDGRQVQMNQAATIAISNSGTATHVALTDDANLLYVTTCTSQALTAGGTVTIPLWTVTIRDPT